MKKPTIKNEKKQIIMTCLTLMLAIAVYINYTTTPTKFIISARPLTRPWS